VPPITELSPPAPGDIMIVDDNPANLKLLEDMLLQQGYEVHSFLLGSMAVAAAKKHPPDLFLLDVNMPEMDGYEVCGRLKSMEELSDIPVMFLSALSDTQDKIEAFRCGAVDYISKPFRFEEVHARVETHLKLHGLQRALQRQNERLEAAVAARTLELSTANECLTVSVREKELLLQEVHHRVNNNLQIICGLLSMQSGATDDPLVVSALLETQNRIHSMATIHRTLYDSRNFSEIELAEYTRLLAAQVSNSYGVDPVRIHLAFDLEPIHLEVDRAIPCGLILNELLSNALKHAFPNGRQGEVRISSQEQEGWIQLAVEDNGVGLPKDLVPSEAESLGLSLVNTLLDQLGGTMETTSKQGSSRFVVRFVRMTGET
jgi:two-component sensor histidine kinase